MQPETDSSLDGVIRLLKHRNRADLSQLLQRAWLELDESDQYGSYLFSTLDNQGRPHSRLGPGLPESNEGFPIAPSGQRHQSCYSGDFRRVTSRIQIAE